MKKAIKYLNTQIFIFCTGYVKIKARVSNTERTKSKELELIAGAIYTAIPVLKALILCQREKEGLK